MTLFAVFELHAGIRNIEQKVISFFTKRLLLKHRAVTISVKLAMKKFMLH